MILACSACGARRSAEERLVSSLAMDLGGRIRCPDCGAFDARVLPSGEHADPSPVMPTIPPLQDLGGADDCGWAGRPLRLKRGERVFRVRDLDRLRRLVVLRKAGASDLLSADGVRWVPLASIPSLEPFLAVVRRLGLPREEQRGSTLVEATAAELGWAEGEAEH